MRRTTFSPDLETLLSCLYQNWTAGNRTILSYSPNDSKAVVGKRLRTRLLALGTFRWDEDAVFHNERNVVVYLEGALIASILKGQISIGFPNQSLNKVKSIDERHLTWEKKLIP